MRKLKRVKTILTTTAIVTIGVFSMFLAQADAKTFKDVKSSHWAYKSIELVSNQNIIEGYPDGTFKPNNNVTRAEFAAMLARTIKGDEKGSHSFSDVPSSHWASDIIGQGIAQGFIDPKDYSNGKFEPNKSMTRSEMAKWMANGLATKNTEYKQAIEDSRDTLLPIPEYYKGGLNKADIPYIAVAMGTGLLNGYPDDTFRPAGNTTRAEVATLITRYQDVMAKQPNDFFHLREFRAVGTTGTNVEVVTPYKITLPFSNVRGKEIPHTRGVGVAKINRLIFIDGGTPSTSKSAYAKMFTTETDAKWHTGKSYPVFVEKTFTVTAPVDKTFTDKYNNNNLNTLLYGYQLNPDARKKFNIPGYGNDCTQKTKECPDEFFRTLKPNESYWEITSQAKAQDWGHINIDSNNENRFLFELK